MGVVTKSDLLLNSRSMLTWLLTLDGSLSSSYCSSEICKEAESSSWSSSLSRLSTLESGFVAALSSLSSLETMFSEELSSSVTGSINAISFLTSQLSRRHYINRKGVATTYPRWILVSQGQRVPGTLYPSTEKDLGYSQ